MLTFEKANDQRSTKTLICAPTPFTRYERRFDGGWASGTSSMRKKQTRINSPGARALHLRLDTILKFTSVAEPRLSDDTTGTITPGKGGCYARQLG